MARGSTPPEICRRWVHSHEEDAGDAQVYRPGDHAFPPSRGRRCLDLRSDGSLLESGPGADDRAAGSRGRWTLDRNRLRLFPDAATEAGSRELEVVSLASDRLVVRRSTSRPQPARERR